MPTQRLREAWAGKRPVLNAWFTMASPDAAELMARAGFDVVTFDVQHGALPAEEAGSAFAVIEAAGAVPFARPRWNHPDQLMRLLDVGARGLICPMVGSGAEAAAVVAAARYPPEGVRSYGPVRGAHGEGRDHVTRSNESVLVFAMIETADGLRNVEEIAATPGLDGVYVGPADLSLGLGLRSFADLSDPELLQALDAVVGAARRAGVVAGIHAPRPQDAARMIDRGFRFVCPAVDADVLQAGAARAIAETRDALGA
jgi:4-hydroxy-2-oxoheptanedioate aldolase